MSHSEPRQDNDIRHYSRLMLLPLPCHATSNGLDAENPVFQNCAYILKGYFRNGEIKNTKNLDVKTYFHKGLSYSYLLNIEDEHIPLPDEYNVTVR